MKSIAMLVLGAVLSTSAVAQTKVKLNTKASTSINVPSDVNLAFQEKYTDAGKQKWSHKAGGNYSATFMDANQVKQEVEFDAKGKYLRSRTHYTKEQFPEVVSTSVEGKFPGAEVKEVSRIEVDGISPYYKVNIMDGTTTKTVLVSEAGDISE